MQTLPDERYQGSCHRLFKLGRAHLAAPLQVLVRDTTLTALRGSLQAYAAMSTRAGEIASLAGLSSARDKVRDVPQCL